MESRFFLLPHEGNDATRRSGSSLRPLVVSLVGLVGGLLAAGGTRLPLATLPGLGSVSFADYQGARAAVCFWVALAVAAFCLARLFRVALLGSGLLAGLLMATGMEMQRSVKDLTTNAATAGSETADLANKVLEATRPEVGALLLAAGCVLCVLASFVGIRSRGWRG